MIAHFQQSVTQATSELSGVGQLPPIGRIHFIGIGGIGMSGIAEIMHNLGFQVQGSDLVDSATVVRLQAMGIEVFIGHSSGHISGADVVAISSAVGDDNVEVVAARSAGIAVVRRAEILAELMRLKPCITVAGTHGKTTTTSLISALFDGGGLAPTVINGGVINAYGTNARLGTGSWMVVEADESDGTFTHLPSTIAVVTNIDSDHLDYFGSFDALKQAFRHYVQNIPFYGFAVMCGDHPAVRGLMSTITERRIFTYGFDEDVDLRAVDIRDADGRQYFRLLARDGLGIAGVTPSGLEGPELMLPMAGRHNLSNALAAIAIALLVHVPIGVIADALSNFSGVNRRFTEVGVWQGIRIIDDYAHHPNEIMAALTAARSFKEGRVIAIVEPHRYSRLRDMFDQFCAVLLAADIVGILPIYAAGEASIVGIDQAHLVSALRAAGHLEAHQISDERALAGFIATHARAGDIVLCMGAGSISRFVSSLPSRLEENVA